MKDYTPRELEDRRPEIPDGECVKFCLNRLYRDKKHRITDTVCEGLTYEELIGALLSARDATEPGRR